jgi:hypothetical protein
VAASLIAKELEISYEQSENTGRTTEDMYEKLEDEGIYLNSTRLSTPREARRRLFPALCHQFAET